MANYTVQVPNTDYLSIETLFAGTGWTVVSGALRHSSSKTTSVSKVYPELEIGKSYRVSFTMTNYESCDVYLKVGSYISDTYSSDGIHTFNLTLADTNIVEFIGNGYFDITNFSINTDVMSYSIVSYDDADIFENKSFTVSFDPINEHWISYHTYVPDIYIPHTSRYLMFDNKTNVEIAHADNHDLEFILETVFNENPLHTKVFNSLQINSEAFEDELHVNKFFTDLVVYNDDQISGNIPLNTTNLTRKERDWNINKFADISLQSTKQKLFNTEWEYKKDSYPIDKVINNSAINVNKEWYRRGRFRNKYLVARFIDKSLENKKIIVNFVNTIYRLSQR